MSLLSGILRDAVGGHLRFWCPACDMAHGIRVASPGAPGGWTWDGNTEAPTFSPSLLVETTRLSPASKIAHRAWVDAGCPSSSKPVLVPEPLRCHSFVRAGHFEYLGDCTHALAGQRVPMIPWPFPGEGL